MTLIELREKLEKSWNKNTSYDPNNFSKINSAWGQCAITTLIIQDHFGGLISKGLITTPEGKEYRHYWNNIEGLDIDFTWRQFPTGSTISEIGIIPRKQLLKSRSTQSRYMKLSNRVDHIDSIKKC